MTRPRRWRFGPAEFDEAAWSLVVAGERVTLENKPLQLLRALLQRPGEAVSKRELIDTVWPGVLVFAGSLPTAMNKLRRPLGDSAGTIIETVPGIGYRLGVPVLLLVPTANAAQPAPGAAPPTVTTRVPASLRRKQFGIAAIATLMAATAVLAITLPRAAPATPRPVTQREVTAALRGIDLVAIQSLLDRGWNPNAPLDAQRNNAIDGIFEVCQWDPAHDQRRLMQAVRMLMDGGAQLTDRNVWGDTPLSIASSPRYCGKNHPVTRAMRAACTHNDMRLNTACLADYAHSDWPQLPAHASDARMSAVPAGHQLGRL